MSEIRDRVGRTVAEAIVECWDKRKLSGETARAILSIPELAVVDRKAELPDPDPHNYEGEFEAICATKDVILKEGWVKEVKE